MKHFFLSYNFSTSFSKYLFPSFPFHQLLKAWGAHVTVTCSQNAEGLVRGLGADEVVDYTAEDAPEQLEMMAK